MTVHHKIKKLFKGGARRPEIVLQRMRYCQAYGLLAVAAVWWQSAACAAQIGFLYALEADWQGLLKASGSQPVPHAAGDRRLQKLTAGGHVIWAVKMGSGIAETAVSTTCLLHRGPFDLLISAGPAGSLKDAMEPGTLVVIDRLLPWQTNGPKVVSLTLPLTSATRQGRPAEAAPRWLLAGGQELPGVTGASGEYFVNTTGQRQELAAQAEIVDMNTLGVETAAAAWKVPCLHLRVISDRANESAREDFLAFEKSWDGRCGTLAWTVLTSLKPDPTHPKSYDALRELLVAPPSVESPADASNTPSPLPAK